MHCTGSTDSDSSQYHHQWTTNRCPSVSISETHQIGHCLCRPPPTLLSAGCTSSSTSATGSISGSHYPPPNTSYSRFCASNTSILSTGAILNLDFTAALHWNPTAAPAVAASTLTSQWLSAFCSARRGESAAEESRVFHPQMRISAKTMLPSLATALWNRAQCTSDRLHQHT